jgi:hypothetical protein
MICNYNTRPIELVNLQRLTDWLQSKIDEHDVDKVYHYNWFNNNKCKYGMSCTKTNTYNNEFTRTTQKLDILISGYIEQTDCSDYHTLLRYLQGYFPNVYREVELNVRKHAH